MESVGVGLIGTGYMGKCHALAWNAVNPVFGDCPDIRLVHLAEVSEDLAAAKARELGFEKSTAAWRAVVEDPQVDVVSITTPNAFHAEMAIAALEGGKHVWCEKPMAPAVADAVRMRDAAVKSGRAAVLGYNYIQNPVMRHIGALLEAGEIGAVHHVRFEMDEDFMADPKAHFFWKSEAASGYGALDDFAVHPLSLIHTLLGPVSSVMADMAKPYDRRPLSDGGHRPVETFDVASVLLRLESGAAGTLCVSRSAWGRKGRVAMQIFGSEGAILFDQERMNEFQLYRNQGHSANQGFSTILASPDHPPYDRFLPAPGHGLGFNDQKVIECRQLLSAMSGDPAHVIDFEEGLAIERTIHAMARSFEEGRWADVPR
ncbi:Gfo/Idh/MocA family oxidoreductase [Nitratireductor sp. XY-223]|uniref:Gfo/Idh/MocA family protein n=1 Tax=Nitratireductor sp. XY-223 TaxID=2561926 RepID=UPI0010AA0B98|nr:Gfo/Idh/MocA family oxidoreductase [Nitratireductor sp. XY-223]